MIQIINKNNNIEIEYNNLMLLQCDNTRKAIKDLFLDATIIIDEKHLKKEDVIYINELTKINDFVDLSKKSFLIEMINSYLAEKQLVNYEFLNEIVNSINEELQIDILNYCIGDQNKLINILFEIDCFDYLNQEIFELIINKCFSDKKLIIFDDVSWLSIYQLYKYLNNHHFIILTSDFRNYIKSIKDFEILYILKQDQQINKIYDLDVLTAYLEKNMNEPINNEKISNLIQAKDSIFSLKLFSLIKQI